MNNFFGHLHTINRHKYIVMKLCFRCGLYKQGLFHDLSKYSLLEFTTGVKYFQGNRSPNSIDRERHGYSAAWLHHKGKNKHHWEYWVDLIHGECVPIRMPVPYVIEMWCDRIAATMVYEKTNYTDASAYQYFIKHYDHVIMHQDTKDLLEYLLCYTKDYGLDQTIVLIKSAGKTKGYHLINKKEVK